MSSITTKNLSFIEGVSGDGKSRVRVEFVRSKLPSRWLVALLVVPMLIAIGISSYLMWVTLTASEVVGCTGGQLFDCSHVIYSKWSKAFGVPVSGLALVTYLGMISAAVVTVSSRFTAATREFAWMIVTLLAVSAALAALYFIFLQVSVLEHLCPWCLGAHACGLLITFVILAAGSSRLAAGKLSAVSGLAAAGLALLIGVQVNSEAPPKFEMIEYVPPTSVLANVPAVGAQTFTSAPQATESTDDGMMAPPIGDDDLFAPPTDSMDFEPPAEDSADETSAAKVSFSAPHIRTSLAMTSQLLLCRSPISSALLYQQQGSASKQQTGSSSKQASGSTTKKPSGSSAKQETTDTAEPKAKKKKKDLRVVQFMGRKINAYQWPIDGPPSAKHIFVEMFDYTCPHCRTTSKAILKVKEQMGDDLSVILLPVPMNTRCNPNVQVDHADHQEACELSTLAVAVWRIAPEKFSAFHHWMMEGDKSPTYSDALAKAGEMVGSEAIEAELEKGTSAAFVTSHTKMYKLLNGGAVPKLLFPTTAVQGEFTSVQALTEMIREKAAQ